MAMVMIPPWKITLGMKWKKAQRVFELHVAHSNCAKQESWDHYYSRGIAWRWETVQSWRVFLGSRYTSTGPYRMTNSPGGKECQERMMQAEGKGWQNKQAGQGRAQGHLVDQLSHHYPNSALSCSALFSPKGHFINWKLSQEWIICSWPQKYYYMPAIVLSSGDRRVRGYKPRNDLGKYKISGHGQCYKPRTTG